MASEGNDAFSERVRSYVMSLEGVMASNTVRLYRRHLGVALRDAEELGLEPDPLYWGEREVLALRDRWVTRYVPISVAARFSALNGLLLHCGNGIIPTMRSRRRLRLPRPSRMRVRWTDEAVADRLIRLSEGNTRVVLVLGYGLGLRREEIANLPISGIRTGYLDVVGKGEKPRTLPLDGWVLEELHRHLRVRGREPPDRHLLPEREPFHAHRSDCWRRSVLDGR